MFNTGREEKTVMSTRCTWRDSCLNEEKDGELNIKNTSGQPDRIRVPLTGTVKHEAEYDFMKNFTLEHCDNKIQPEQQMEILSRQLINHGDELVFFLIKVIVGKYFTFQRDTCYFLSKRNTDV